MSRPHAGHHGRVFYSYLLSFLLILLVPVVMSIVVFGRANSLVTSESTRANEALLDATGVYLDQLLEDVGQLRYLIANNNQLYNLLVRRGPVAGDEYFLAYELVADLVDYRDSSSAVIDFYVYIPLLDMVVGPNGYFSIRSYDLSLRDQRFETREVWLTDLAGVRGHTLRTGRYARVPRTESSYVPVIELVIPLPLEQGAATPRGFAVLQIDSAPFSHRFGGAKWEEQSVFFALDSDHNVVATSEPSIDLTPVLSSYANHTTIPSYDRMEIAGEQYVGFSRASESPFDWTYVALIPADLYTNEFDQLRRFTVAALALCALVGGVLIYVVSLYRYRPIRNLLAMLEPDVDGTFTLRSDEFEMIRASLRATLAEERLLREELVESRDVLLQRTLQQLLKGTVAETDELRDRVARLGLVSSAAYRWVAGFEPDLLRRSLYPAIADQVRRAAASWDGLVVEVDGVICVLFGGAAPPVRESEDRLARLKTNIESRHGIACAVGISNAHRSDEGLPILYQEMRAALSYRLVKGAAAPIHFSEVLMTGQAYFYPIEEETRLINSITAGAYPAAEAILAKVFESNFNQTQLSVEMARCLMFDLIATMIRALSSLSSADSDAHFWSETRPIVRLTSCHSLEELRSEMTRILHAVCDHVIEGRSSHTVKLRDHMLSIISENLHDRNLGPDFIADRLNMNSAYVARFFRDEVGCGMSQHIKKLRVQEARKAIEESDATVREIALRLGFADSNALIRAFKSIEGVTPGEFRQSVAAPQ